MKRRVPCVVVLALSVLALPLTATPAFANAPIMVTTTADVVNAGDGQLSLREAVTKANTDAGADTIQLAATATYELTICSPSFELQNVEGDLNIRDVAGTTFEGAGSIVRQTCDPADRERVLDAASGPLTLDDLTITGGNGFISFSSGGGAIHVENAGHLTLDKVTVRDNATADLPNGTFREAGAVQVWSDTDVTVTDSVFRDNTGMAGLSSDGPVVISHSEFSGNAYPGGIAAAVRGRGVTIEDSSVHDNSVLVNPLTWYGTGGIFAGPLVVRRSTFQHNHGTGAGALASSDALVEDTLLDSNSSEFTSGAALLEGTVRRTVVTGNTAAASGGGLTLGGLIEDSTISGNRGAGGGGIAFEDLIVRRSTVTMNTADVGAGLAPLPNPGGSVPDLTLDDSTVAGNIASAAGPGAVAAEISLFTSLSGAPVVPFVPSLSVVGDGSIPNCDLRHGSVTSGGFNFVTDASCLASATPTDIVSVGDPKLGPLQDNGGPTPTRLPLPGSPLRDRIPLSNAACTGNDQRGVSRPQGLGCDIGATEVAVPPSGFVGMAPKRILDTRTAPVPTGWSAGTKLSPAGWLDLKVAGANGVPADATAVVLNVTSTEATSALSYVTAWSAGAPLPDTSNLNLQPNANVANSITVAPGVDGSVSFAINTGATHLVVDVLGYYKPTGGDRFTGVTPIRMLDTRYGPVPSPRPIGQKLSGPGSIRLPIAGANGVPADVTSVVVNITSTQVSTDLAFLTAWPAGDAKPTASNLNLQPPYNVSNLAFVKVGAGGAIDLYTNAGSTHLVVDVVGYFRPSTGDKFLPLNPTRMFDSRANSLLGPSSAAFAQVSATRGVPSNATSVVLNATSTQASSPGGYLIVFGKGAVLSNETGSNLNFRPPYNAPNQVISPVGIDHSVGLWNGYGTVHIVLDANGYFVSTP